MTDYDNILEQCRQGNDDLWNTLVKAIPTSKLAEKRYQDPFLKRLMDYEVFADKEVVDGGILGYDTVISIKGCRDFWDEEGK